MPDKLIGTILAATDFSEASKVALDQAVATARAEHAKLILLHVATGDEEAPGDALAAIANSIEGVAVESMVRDGHPDEVIAAAAEEFGADLVVTGTHGRSGLKRFLLGSVAEKVVRLSPTNTLVARPKRPSDKSDSDEAAHGGLFRSILIPTDFAPASERALRLALLLAAPGATIELFHAWQFPPGTKAHGLPNDERSPLAALQREIETASADNGKAWLDRHREADLTLKFTQRYGGAAQIVQERLEKGSYDLVATGTHGRRGFRRFVLGSVAEATVRHSPCSVLVAHAGSL